MFNTINLQQKTLVHVYCDQEDINLDMQVYSPILNFWSQWFELECKWKDHKNENKWNYLFASHTASVNWSLKWPSKRYCKTGSQSWASQWFYHSVNCRILWCPILFPKRMCTSKINILIVSWEVLKGMIIVIVKHWEYCYTCFRNIRTILLIFN